MVTRSLNGSRHISQFGWWSVAAVLVRVMAARLFDSFRSSDIVAGIAGRDTVLELSGCLPRLPLFVLGGRVERGEIGGLLFAG